MANLLPPDIDEILESDEWKSFTPDERNDAVDEWALQTSKAADWTPDEVKEIDSSVDRFRTSALESLGEQGMRIVKDGVVGGLKSLATLPLAIPKLGLQSGNIIGLLGNALATGEDPSVTARAMAREAPEIGALVTGAEKTAQGAETLARLNNPLSADDELWEAEVNGLRSDVLDRNLPEDPDQLYNYLKKKAFRIAQKTSKLYGGEADEYMPQEFQGGNEEEIFKNNFKTALTGQRPEGFIEFDDDTVPQQGLVIKNQSRSLIASPENLGLLLRFSSTRNPIYFEALKQRLGRSRERQVTDAVQSQIERQRSGADVFDDAAQTIFGLGGAAPEFGQEMVEQTRSMSSSPVDIATTLFSFGLGKQAVRQALQKNLLKSAGSVAAGSGAEFLQGVASGLQEAPIPTTQALVEEGLMEAVGGGAIQAAGAGVGASQSLGRRAADAELPAAEAPTQEALLTPEEQAEIAPEAPVAAPDPAVDIPLATADAIEPVAPDSAEALREIAVDPDPVEEAEEVLPTVEALEDASETSPSAAIDFTGMPQDEYAEYLAENGPPEGVTMYDALTARPEQRGFTPKQRAALFTSDPASARAFTQRVADFWNTLRQTPIPGVKARGADSSWTNFEVNQDSHQPGTPRFKSYATLANPLALSEPQIQGLLETLRDAGYNGQVKLPGLGSRALTSFDNVVMHGATEQDAVLGEQVARRYFGDEVIATQFGVDEGGKSHTSKLAEDTEARWKAKGQAPIVNNETAPVAEPRATNQPETQESSPVVEAPTVPAVEEFPPPELNPRAKQAQADITRHEGTIIRIQTALDKSLAAQTSALESDGKQIADSYDIRIETLREQLKNSKKNLDHARKRFSDATRGPSVTPKASAKNLAAVLTESIRKLGNQRGEVKLTRASQKFGEVLTRYLPLFNQVKIQKIQNPSGGLFITRDGTLEIDLETLADTFLMAPNEQQGLQAFEAMLDEEFRHAVSIELDRTSPAFSESLTELWEALPQEVKDQSAKAYFKDENATSASFPDAWVAKHEFFRQYWQNADLRQITENSLKEQGLLGKLQDLINLFIEQLRNLQNGASPEVKPILDRLIAQAEQRAQEIRNKNETPASSPPTRQTETREAPPETQAPAPVQESTEPRAVEEEHPEVVSVKREDVDRDRAARGEIEIPSPTARGWADADRESMTLLKDNPNEGFELVKSLLDNPRAISDVETSILLFHKVAVRRRLRELAKQMTETQDQMKIGDLKSRYDELLNEQNNIDHASRKSGSEKGRSLNSQKMWKSLDETDFSLEALLQEYRTGVKLGAPLTEDEQSTVKKSADNIQEKQQAYNQAVKLEEDIQAAPIERRLAMEALNEIQQARAIAKGGVKKLLKDKKAEALSRLKERTGLAAPAAQGLSAPAPADQDFQDYAIVGASFIEDGATNRNLFSKQMLDQFGGKVRPLIDALYDKSKQLHKEAVEAVERENAKLLETSSPKGVLEAGRKRVADKPSDKIDRKLAADIFKAHVRARASLTPEQANTATTNSLREIYPNITESDTRVAITDYGKAKWPTKDLQKAKEAEYRRILRLVESLERLQAGRQALKSGLQRSKPSARERELQAEIKEAMKKMGVETTREDQLTSTKKAITNRLKNEIEDYTLAIQGKAKPKQAREQVQYDAEINALVKERDALKAYLDDLTGPSKEGKWNQTSQRASRAMAENYRRKIERRDFDAREKMSFTPTEATKKLQEEAEEAKEEFMRLRELTGLPQAEQLQRQREALQREILKVEDRIQTGAKPSAGTPKAKPAELELMRQQLKVLKETDRILNGPDPEIKRANNASKAVQRSIDRLNAEIKRRESLPNREANVTLPSDRREPVENEHLKQLRQDRDFLREQLDALREAETPRRLPEEIALDNFKRRTEKLRADMQRSLNEDEFLTPPPQSQLREVRERANKAKRELDKARREWVEEMFQAKLKNRTNYQKFKDNLGEILGLARALKTGGEFSAIMRQGKLALGHPVVWAKSVPASWKSFRSEDGLAKIQQEIEDRPNFINGAYKRLAIVDNNAVSMTKREEDFQSRWANKILHGDV